MEKIDKARAKAIETIATNLNITPNDVLSWKTCIHFEEVTVAKDGTLMGKLAEAIKELKTIAYNA